MEETNWITIDGVIQFCKKGGILGGYSQTGQRYYLTKQCSLAAHYTIRIDSKPYQEQAADFLSKIVIARFFK